MSISKTSLCNPATKAKIALAMKEAVGMSFKNKIAGQTLLTNKNGRTMMLVHHSRTYGLKFFDAKGKNITNVVKQALRG
jgi:hypothetical protein